MRLPKSLRIVPMVSSLHVQCHGALIGESEEDEGKRQELHGEACGKKVLSEEECRDVAGR